MSLDVFYIWLKIQMNASNIEITLDQSFDHLQRPRLIRFKSILSTFSPIQKKRNLLTLFKRRDDDWIEAVFSFKSQVFRINLFRRKLYVESDYFSFLLINLCWRRRRFDPIFRTEIRRFNNVKLFWWKDQIVISLN